MYSQMTQTTDAGQNLFNDALLNIAEPILKLVTSDPEAAAVEKPSLTNKVTSFISHRTEDWSIAPQNKEMMDRQMIVWDFLLDYYFRAETTGWERLPDSASMLIGIHSGTWLTMDAWTFCFDWYRHFRGRRVLHGTAHDALMAMPGIGTYFRNLSVIPAKRESIGAAFDAGHDVVIWPGGEWTPCAPGESAIRWCWAAERALSVRPSAPACPLCPWPPAGDLTRCLCCPKAGNWRKCLA